MITINEATKVISVDQSDLTFISGALYDFDTNAYRLAVGALLDDERYIWMDAAFIHNTEVTVAGSTLARAILQINGYSTTFENVTMSVRYIGSNNNLFDVDNGILNPSGNVTVIGQNSAGLQTVVSGSGVTAQDKTDITDQVWAKILDGGYTAQELVALMAALQLGKSSGHPTVPKFRDLADTKDRITATLDASGNRTSVTLDPD